MRIGDRRRREAAASDLKGRYRKMAFEVAPMEPVLGNPKYEPVSGTFRFTRRRGAGQRKDHCAKQKRIGEVVEPFDL